jgi:ribonuclease/clavin/mitogillin
VDIHKEVYPGIFLIRPGVAVPPGWDLPNIYLMGRNKLTLVDAGFPAERTLEMILEAVGERTLERIIITHGHRDHFGVASQLRQQKGCEILCHPSDFPLLEGRFAGFAPDRALAEGDIFSVEGMELNVIKTPGHSPGHICLWMAKERILISGDLVVGSGTSLVGPPDGNMKDYMDSLEKVRKLNPALILPGHGPVVENSMAKIDELIEHRQLREINIAKVLSTGPKTIMEILNAVYLGLIHPGLHGAAICTIMGHLEKLLAEKKIAFEPEEAPPEKRTYRLTVPTPLPF